MNRIPTVTGFGTAILDLLARVDDAFIRTYSGGGKGGMVLVDEAARNGLLARLTEYEVSPGGSVGNTIAGLLRLGLKGKMLGKVGRDEEGRIYVDRFAKLGGDVSSFKYSEKAATGCCICLVTPDSERTMRTCLGAASELSEKDFRPEDLDGVDLLHMEGYQLYSSGMFELLVREAKRRGIPVSFDFSSYEIVRTFRDRIEALLKDVDIVFANEDEAAEFIGQDRFSPEKALDVLSGYCATAVVKLGKKGALLRRGNETKSVQARSVAAVDTTGAGDLWQAGFLYGYLTGKPLEICGKIGSLLGAEVVQVFGATIPEERWRTISEEIQKMQETR